ncbi:late embryogenesis abundant protein D-29-like [Camellia sinensis]|uniref:late embryogenesis abundant protein D-29-like n=1 Tax=Camellia sinensis TaxID=4442 RepID=UPI0010365953|nr:late embryogenesis abundant protein D-29-like [Camellia sinensis]
MEELQEEYGFFRMVICPNKQGEEMVAVAVAIVGSSGNVVEDECVKEEKGKVIKDKAEEKAAETGREAKEASESWAEWAKEKITEGLGFKVTKEAKDATATATAIAMHTKDEISRAGQYNTDKSGEVKNEEAAEKAVYAKETTFQKAEEAKHKA